MREQAKDRAARVARQGHSVEPLTLTPQPPQPSPPSDYSSDIEFDFGSIPAVSPSFVSRSDWAAIQTFHKELGKEKRNIILSIRSGST
jgi:hypothetical protein